MGVVLTLCCCCIAERHEDEGDIAAVRRGDSFGLYLLKTYYFFTGGLICRREMRNYG